MRFGAVPENPIEWVIARLNVAPRPLLETQMAYTLARLIMVATKLGVFEALAEGPSKAPEVAERCGTSPAGTEKLLFALAGAEYLRACFSSTSGSGWSVPRTTCAPASRSRSTR
jgi:hypothetical protein